MMLKSLERTMRRVLNTLLFFCAGFSLCIVSCNSSNGGDPGPSDPGTSITSVAVAPSTASVINGQTQQFTATVQGTGSFSSAVNWLVNDVPGGNSTLGTISAIGLYTAPATVPSPNQVTVKAVSAADATKSGSAQVTVQPAIAISLATSSALPLTPLRIATNTATTTRVASEVSRATGLTSGSSVIVTFANIPTTVTV